MAYDLVDIEERVREYIAVRHPHLHLADNCSLRVVIPDGYPTGEEAWMFHIEYRNPAMRRRHLVNEFMRYTTDMPIGDMEPWQGCGCDYITVRSGRPLAIGDGDDSLAIEARDGYIYIWLRNCP